MFKYLYKNRGVFIIVTLICFGFIFLNISQVKATEWVPPWLSIHEGGATGPIDPPDPGTPTPTPTEPTPTEPTPTEPTPTEPTPTEPREIGYKPCTWKSCSTTGLCNVPESSRVPVDEDCPTGCTSNSNCTTTPPPPLPIGCSINGFDITPSSRTTLLGFNFTASWDTNGYCTNCTLSCGPDGCGIVAGGLSVSSTSGTLKITPTKVGSTYSYTLECMNTDSSDSKTLGGSVTGDGKFFKVINPFWRETPAFLKLLVDKLFQR